ncbi:nuclease-related domain-containing protein [Metasolibacillus meyeri]|uniref:nuclease-related domain-containing protein n=1 Tax=Metasolibacillus meyeri TaxID=1071052 RepID=UPI000D30E71F|nr:nuclease-related domain-containing protein [Metasolibacillus meyeri]
MIVLPREKSVREAMLTAAVRRGFFEYKNELIRVQQGLVGEYYVDRQWDDMQLNTPYFLLHDFQTSKHQIDTLFLCHQFLLILEIKNITGIIEIDNTPHQFTRKLKDGSVQGFRNPLNQAQRHQRMLEQYIRTLPIFYVVVLAHPKTIIERIPPNAPIIHSSGLESYVRDLLASHPPCLTNDHLEQLLQQLLQMRVSVKPKLNIDASLMRRGVLCNQCAAQMYYKHGNFICLDCVLKDDGTLLQRALSDYYLLVDEWISNEQFRTFLGIDSIHAAKRLLKKLELPYVGEKRVRKYRILWKH